MTVEAKDQLERGEEALRSPRLISSSSEQRTLGKKREFTLIVWSRNAHRRILYEGLPSLTLNLECRYGSHVSLNGSLSFFFFSSFSLSLVLSLLSSLLSIRICLSCLRKDVRRVYVPEGGGTHTPLHSVDTRMHPVKTQMYLRLYVCRIMYVRPRIKDSLYLYGYSAQREECELQICI